MCWLLQLWKSVSIWLTGRERRGEAKAREEVPAGCLLGEEVGSPPGMSGKCRQALCPSGFTLQGQLIFHPQVSCLHDKLTSLPVCRQEADTCPGKDLPLSEDQIWGVLCLLSLLAVVQKAYHHLNHQTPPSLHQLPINVGFARELILSNCDAGGNS